MKRSFLWIWAAGLTLLLVLVGSRGFSEVGAAVAVAGWGLLWVALFHVVPMAIDALGWYVLLPGRSRRPFTELLWMRWFGESVNGLLPVAQVGGDFLRVRLLSRSGVAPPLAGASVVVDLTATVVTQIVFAMIGLVLLVERGGGGGVIWELVAGIGVFSLLVAGFYLAQRAGLFFALSRALESIVGSPGRFSIRGGAADLDRWVRKLYRRQRAFWCSCFYHLAAWMLGAGEVWLALYFLGVPVTWADALILESLGMAVRAAAFAVPGALGVQEGGFILLGPLVGLTPDTALALSLVKRVRELALGVPGLIAWQIEEGWNLIRRQQTQPSDP